MIKIVMYSLQKFRIWIDNKIPMAQSLPDLFTIQQ